MRQRIKVITFLMIILIISVGAGRAYRPKPVNVDQFERLYTTAYCLDGITANGSTVHVGGCACNPHLGEVAIVYSQDGEYLGTFEVNDTGATDGLRNGSVIDIWYPDMEACKKWMKKTGGVVYVQWVPGVG